MARCQRQAKRISFRIHLINVCIITTVVIAGYLRFVQTILGYNRGKEFPKPLEPACQNRCTVSVPHSSVYKFKSFSLDSTQVLFVHFSGYNLSFESSDKADILDPLNFVWVESNEAPFLSLDLGFNMYSFTTLSRIIHHMKVKVEVEPINCLRNMSHGCVTANLARAFLGNITKERGVLCYAVNDKNTVNYRCCKGNVETQEVECDIPAVFSSNMTQIFRAIASAAFIALLCFPALFNIIPDKRNSDTLYTNGQVHNPLYQIVIRTVQALRHYSIKYYCVNVLRKLLIALALPTLYYVGLGMAWHTKTYDIPKMFNDAVNKKWVLSKGSAFHPSLFVIVSYAVVMVPVSFLKQSENLKFSSSAPYASNTSIQSLLEEEKYIEVDWWEPFVWIKDFFCWLKSHFEKATDSERSICSRSGIFLGSILLSLLSPVVVVLIFISYIGHVSPLGKIIRSFVYHGCLYYFWAFDSEIEVTLSLSCIIHYFSFAVGFVIASGIVCFNLAIIVIFFNSLLLSANLIVYLWMGLVASKDYYFPRIAFFSVFVYYSWSCLSSVTSRYQILLRQTFEKCKEQQEKQPNCRKALTFDEEGAPRISSELFQRVIDKILPRSEVYTNMILKLAIILSFLFLTFSSILVYGKTNFDDSTKALALFLTALLPKVIEIFGEGSSRWQLYEMANACRVEKIVKDFLRQSIVNNYIIYGVSDNEEQPFSNPSGDQLPTASTEHHQPISEERPAHITALPNVRRKQSSGGNDRGDKNLLVVQADVDPRVQSINSGISDDTSTEGTPLLFGHRGRKDRNKIT